MVPRHTSRQKQILSQCWRSYAYFLHRFAYIENATEQDWVPFALWPAQSEILATLCAKRQVIVLKARQLGITWLVIGYILARLLFAPVTVALFFSRGETEAKELLMRLKGMYSRLPDWMKDGPPILDNTQEWRLQNGSRALSFPTTGGRSFTASIVVVDEADFIDDLGRVMNAVKPTIDAGGKMILISTVDKGKPASPFKQMFRGAKRGDTDWLPVFLPWHVRPGRDDAWYETQKADVLARTGSLDDMHQEYPATDTEALAPRSLDKRISPMWIEACYEELVPTLPDDAPAISGLEIYIQPGLYGGLPLQYVLGCDPAEGNPASDDSALTVLDVATGEECAVLAGKFEPSTFAAHIASLSSYYWDAPAMIERNNHGHAVIQWVAEHADHVQLLRGHDDKVGWMSSSLGKAKLYTECADHFRQNAQAGTKILHSFASYTQLAGIDGSKLRAPDGMHDDRADSFAMAHVGRAASIGDPTPSMHFHVAGRGGRPQVRRGRL